MTRAQALLIVVGDPNVLSLDPLWASFLNYIRKNGGWRGPPSQASPATKEGNFAEGVRATGSADMNDFARRMEAITLSGVGEEVLNDVDSANADRPWRILE